MPGIFDLVGAVGRKADTASSTGTAHAKLKQLLTDLGLLGDAASATGSANAKLASLMPLIQGTTKIQAVYPALAAQVAAAWSGVAWTLGTYVEFVASLPSACELVGFAVANVDAAVAAQISFGVGAAGVEVEIARTAAYWSSNAGWGGYIPIVPAKIANGARLSFAIAAPSAQTVRGWAIVLPTPL